MTHEEEGIPIRVIYIDKEFKNTKVKKGNLVRISDGFVVVDNCPEEHGQRTWIPIDSIILMVDIEPEELVKLKKA